MENLIGMLLGIFAIVGVFMIAIYVYMSLAYVSIAKKAKLKEPLLAWIPGVGPLILAFQASKMHWWPWLLYIGIIIPFLNIVISLIITAFSIIWHWKLFEAIKKPGWWALLLLIPIVNLVIIGVAAWSD